MVACFYHEIRRFWIYHACVIEHGFHTNKATCNWLLNNSNLEKLAKAEVEVIANHYKLTKKETGFKQYIVRTTANSLNGREGAGTSYDITIKIPIDVEIEEV